MLQHTMNNAFQMTREHTVLRNTMGMLALALLPATAGAVLGTHMNWGFMGSIGILIGSIVLLFATMAFRNSSMGIFMLLGFTGLMGLSLGPLLQHTLQFNNGPELISVAFGGTMLTFAGSFATVMNTQKDFSVWGRGLFWCLIAMIVMGLLNIWLQLPWLQFALACVGMVVFTMYLLMDLQNVVRGGETNYISATISIFLDLINIFSSLLQILGIFGSRDD